MSDHLQQWREVEKWMSGLPIYLVKNKNLSSNELIGHLKNMKYN